MRIHYLMAYVNLLLVGESGFLGDKERQSEADGPPQPSPRHDGPVTPRQAVTDPLQQGTEQCYDDTPDVRKY